MTKVFFKNLFDTLGLSADFDPVIAQNIDALNFNEKTRETVFLKTWYKSNNIEQGKTKDEGTWGQVHS